MRPKTKKTPPCIPLCHFGIKNPQDCHSNDSKEGPHGPRRPAIVATFVILMRLFFEVRKSIDFRRLLSKFGEGPAAGGGACLKLQILQILKTDPARPAPLSGVRRISEGLRPLPTAPRLEDPMIRRFDDSMDG